ncbi:pyridoxal reductase [Cryptococcus deuterogattii 99/473]|uniref:Pyridoxal reductase n=2 Tax=Cryptococcus deuterogattii TaxID=1859096 RepID=A0A0D0UXT2_9TREE|nr:pyridoxal reductase [Cryptococcus deuterogattii R265]KIR25846.1 pyridoxal reductase [Cryptococcus deuterogattii LA55]KIR40086.1 pyridoxal reductase [Cryptococcus deuterogattii Ram5]KIR71480.1 pyridoxal reductase [Cryptococcus deuterogattii CA1014]KIR91060.1 pyridoxal reductase [Cryptococcus deuterogattii CBS 10090]KIY55875.1 pyridoxal reductase [Cryptococcus deuterogattii 99/473]
MSTVPTVTVAGKQVSRMGYGLMQLTWNPQPPSQDVSFAAMKAAADSGSTIWSSAAFYGNPGDNFANIKLIAAFFDKYPEYKSKIVLVVKGGADYADLHPRGTELHFLRTELKEMKRILGDKEIDVYSLARLPEGSVEEIFKGLDALKKEGLFGEVGASEMSAPSLEKAHKITPIAINEIEISLFSYDKPIRDAIEWHNANKIPVFAYSPLGRGFITRTYKSPDDIPEGDFKRYLPRFQGQAFYENLKLVDKLDEIAARKGVNGSQVALAWILSLSNYIIPIPGSSNTKRVAENIQSANVTLTSEEKKEINDFLDSFEIQGTRYPAQAMAHLMK